MRTIILVVLALFSLSAFGYKTGVHSCKNANPALPDNVYDIKDLNVDGSTLPFVQLTRHHLDRESGEIYTSTIKGIATVSSVKTSEYLSVNQVRLEFVNDKFINCKE